MRITTGTITNNTRVRANLHLIEAHLPQLAQGIQPGQYCMVRCSPAQASDPLLRRPYFVHGVQRAQGRCTLLVHVRGRGSAWLAQQQPGEVLDILGPCGHGWTLRPTSRNLLLIGEEGQLSALTLLAQVALEQELAVTLLNQVATPEEAYPPALLSPEVEYRIVPPNERLPEMIGPLLNWADAVYCSLSHETLNALYDRYERVRLKHMAQGVVLRPLVCGSGACLACSIETRSGAKLVCRDGPVFDVREIVR